LNSDERPTVELLLIWATLLFGFALVVERLDVLVLEAQRSNTWLELQYSEMEWSDETFEAYCAEFPENCEITE
jgi:hypothetical protein